MQSSIEIKKTRSAANAEAQATAVNAGRVDDMAQDTQSDSPLSSNRGYRVNAAEMASLFSKNSKSEQTEQFSQLFFNGKKVLEIPMRRGKGNEAFIDEISFSFDKFFIDELAELNGQLNDVADGYVLEDVERVYIFSEVLKKIFGFGINKEARTNGNRFYNQCFICGDDKSLYGRVHIGGQNDTVLVEITGTGCTLAKDNWQGRLYDFLQKIDDAGKRVKLTRVDVAHDFLDGEYTPDLAFLDYQAGLFNVRGKFPVVDRYGSDWDCDTQKGKTLYIGTRASSRFIRVYDKAKQYGDKDTFYIRAEVEIKGKYCFIPLDILLSPGAYWAGSCEAFARFSNRPSNKHRGTGKRILGQLNNMDEWFRKTCGNYLNLCLQRGMNCFDIVHNAIRNDFPSSFRLSAMDLKAQPRATIQELFIEKFGGFFVRKNGFGFVHSSELYGH